MAMRTDNFDLVIVGGGINGAGIAADAAGRGLSVLLAEMNDLASATSSASSKLIHGGLRYLEHCEFRLVREALGEREVLLAKAPHIIWPLRFVLPQTSHHRSPLLLRAGLFLYDHLGRRRTLPGSRGLDLRADPMGSALRSEIARGFSYWDCWVDDARLVVLNARAAADRGAEIVPRTRVTAVTPVDGHWQVTLRAPAITREVRARALVNATGPWVSDIALRPAPAEVGAPRNAPRVRLVKGSHIVVPRIPGTGDAFIFQHDDGRVVFALPFSGRFTLIGTTDVPYAGDPAAVTASEAEIRYLLDLVNVYLARPLQRADVVVSFAGVRPLYDDAADNPSTVTRDYRLMLEQASGGAPLLTVLGGKITTYRRLAEEAMRMLAPAFPAMQSPLAATAPLPGGDMPAGFESFLADLAQRHPRFRPETLRALARRHGTRVEAIIDGATSEVGLGEVLVAGGSQGDLTAREVSFLARQEWAGTPDDILWRRTKAGLLVATAERARVMDRVAAHL